MITADRFQIHYHLDNNSHAIDAFVKNKCEAELLAVFQEICVILGTSIKLENIPSEEGGFREFWRVYGESSVQINTTLTIMAMLVSIAGIALSRIPVSDPEKDLREKTIQELTIEEKRLAVEEKRLNLEKLRKEMKDGHPSRETIEKAARATEQNLKIQSRRSNFYKQLNAYEKVTGIGFSVLDKQGKELEPERTTPRSDFNKFILFDNSLPIETIDGAKIEIVAPVLKEGNYKWKGIYERETISFVMSDSDFKNQVLHKQVTFQHGSCINCVLHIHRKFNEIGEVEITGYAVVTVLDKIDGESTIETLQGKKHRAYKKFVQGQQTLF